MRTLVVFVCIALGCAEPLVKIPVTGAKASYLYTEMRHIVQKGPRDTPVVKTITIVTISNPSTGQVVLDCDSFRLHVASGTATQVLLTKRDKNCDLHNDD